MKRIYYLGFFVLAVISGYQALALSEGLPRPKIFFPKGYDTNRAEAVQAVLTAGKFKYLGGLTSYWPPAWSTTLVYDGTPDSLNEFVAAMNGIKDINVRLTFSKDLSKETGSSLQAGSWWVKYSHELPDVITIRINLAAEALGRDKFALRLPK